MLNHGRAGPDQARQSLDSNCTTDPCQGCEPAACDRPGVRLYWVLRSLCARSPLRPTGSPATHSPAVEQPEGHPT
ncbi:hypothetical protein ACFPM0_13385 [Pseudonocardia sulfidoxydans]|uniref:hypothetical protein n=1 Tax=Pseudonocardia sulfidoxydans TaxID=54011 RepID=UPI00360D5B9B